MVSTKTTGFRKNESCPTSNELLEFQSGSLAAKRRGEVFAHIDRCEFCAAEVEFYSAFPQQEDDTETIESVAIPAPLFQLAEALLKGRHADVATLNALLGDGLVLDKV